LGTGNPAEGESGEGLSFAANLRKSQALVAEEADVYAVIVAIG
jgi:hypothetical protein